VEGWRLVLVLFVGGVLCGNAPRPHIIVALHDDLGHYNIGFTNPDVKTPHIQDMVKEGIQLERHYVYKYCSPTRSSFLSGRLPIHVNEINDDTAVPDAGIPLGMTTIAKKLKDVGYSTHQIGKWHCGQASYDHIPTGRGFDTSLGYLAGSEDHYTQTRGGFCGKHTDFWKDNKPAYGLNGTIYGGYQFAQAAVDLVSSHDPSVPLFLYLAWQNNHDPYQVPERFKQMYSHVEPERKQIIYGMSSFVDEGLGNLTQALKAKGMWDNTLILFSADNGGPIFEGGNNYPLKGSKRSDWEGGVRAAAFLSGGFLPPSQQGSKQEGYIHICDWYTTFCNLAGADPTDSPKDLPPVDSLDMWGLITNQTTSPRTEIPLGSHNGDCHSWCPATGINLIQGRYKLLLGEMPYSAWQSESFPNTSTHTIGDIKQNCTDGCLFDIINDPSEYNDIASLYPNIAAQLVLRSKQIFATVYNPKRGDPQKAACEVIAQNGGYYAPWINASLL